jgi:hypothetical protein
MTEQFVFFAARARDPDPRQTGTIASQPNSPASMRTLLQDHDAHAE